MTAIPSHVPIICLLQSTGLRVQEDRNAPLSNVGFWRRPTLKLPYLNVGNVPNSVLPRGSALGMFHSRGRSQSYVNERA